MSVPTYYGGASVLGGPKSKFKNTNLNAAMMKTTPYKNTISGNLYVAQSSRGRVLNKTGGPVIGVTALPTPVNAPSLKRENKSKDTVVALLPSTMTEGSSGKVWSTSTDANTASSTTQARPESNAASTSTIASRQKAWGVVQPVVTTTSTEAEVSNGPSKPGFMPSWADAESDEEDETDVEDTKPSKPYTTEYARPSMSNANTVAASYSPRAQYAAPAAAGGWGRSADLPRNDARPLGHSGGSPRGGFSQDARAGQTHASHPSTQYSSYGNQSMESRQNMSHDQQQQQPVHVPQQVSLPSKPVNKEIDEKLAQQQAAEEARKEREDLEKRRKENLALLARQSQVRNERAGTVDGFGSDRGGFGQQRQPYQQPPQQMQQGNFPSRDVNYPSREGGVRGEGDGRWERARTELPPTSRSSDDSRLHRTVVETKTSLPLAPTLFEAHPVIDKAGAKSFSSLFQTSKAPPVTVPSVSNVRQEVEVNGELDRRVEILRNPHSDNAKKMLYDPKKGVLVETDKPPAKPVVKEGESKVLAKKVTLKVPLKISLRSEGKQKEENWKRKAPSAEVAHVDTKESSISEVLEKRAFDKKHVLSVEDQRVADEQKAARALERSTRKPHTKGLLFEYAPDGQIRQVLSDEEQLELQKKASEPSVVKPRKEPRKSDRKASKEGSAGKIRVEPEVSSVPTPVSVSVPVVAKQAPKPAWQAPRQTLADLGVAPLEHVDTNVDAPIKTKPDMKANIATKGVKGKQTKSEKKKQAREKEDSHRQRGPADAAFPIDTTNLDIRNQEQPMGLRSPDSYRTFVPGEGLLQATADSMNFSNLMGLDLGGLGLETSPSKWNRPSLSQWAPTIATGYHAIHDDDDIHQNDAALSSVAFAISDDVPNNYTTHDLVHESAATAAARGGGSLPEQQGRGRGRGRGGRNNSLPFKKKPERGPPRVSSNQAQDSVDPSATSLRPATGEPGQTDGREFSRGGRGSRGGAREGRGFSSRGGGGGRAGRSNPRAKPTPSEQP